MIPEVYVISQLRESPYFLVHNPFMAETLRVQSRFFQKKNGSLALCV